MVKSLLYVIDYRTVRYQNTRGWSGRALFMLLLCSHVLLFKLCVCRGLILFQFCFFYICSLCLTNYLPYTEYTCCLVCLSVLVTCYLVLPILCFWFLFPCPMMLILSLVFFCICFCYFLNETPVCRFIPAFIPLLPQRNPHLTLYPIILFLH